MIDLYKESLQIGLDFLECLSEPNLEKDITELVRALRNGNDELKIKWCLNMLLFHITTFKNREIYKRSVENDYRAISEYYKLSA